MLKYIKAKSYKKFLNFMCVQGLMTDFGGGHGR